MKKSFERAFHRNGQLREEVPLRNGCRHGVARVWHKNGLLANAKIRNGYLLTALSHPLFGRPLVKALAFGSSVPELDPEDLRDFEIVRLARGEEDAIADLAEEAAAKRAKADVLERELAADAGKLIDRFLAGDTRVFVI